MRTRSLSINPRQNERGLTLVELLVSVVIGLLLAIAASATYLYSKNAYNAVSETSQMEENGRFALNLISRYVQSAGFVMLNPKATNVQGSLLNKIRGCDFGMTNASSIATGSDLNCRTSTPTGDRRSASISLFFDTDAYSTTGATFQGFNCVGNRPIETPITDELGVVSFTAWNNRFHFFISTFDSAAPAGTVTRGQLSCIGESNASAGAAVTYQVQPLIPGIEQLAINYVLPSTTSPKVAQGFQTATQVTTANAWGNVMAVEICVLARSIQPAGNDTGSTYTDCYGNAITSTSTDNYRTFRTTVNLRNRTPAL
jgi:type IV pilus assembly protein PilW